MFTRLLAPSSSSSFFIFGARGTGKSTLIRDQFLKSSTPNNLVYDLLDPELEDRLIRTPSQFKAEVEAAYKRNQDHLDWVFIDEVQKVPRLLDIVHQLIESKKIRFILTGSSARKLKRGAANLLAGRAFVYHLFPLTEMELRDQFNLEEALHWGSLPQIKTYLNDSDRSQFLKSYALTYLKEEVQAEQLVRNLTPFRKFLDVAAQCNGKILNFSKIGVEVGTDHNTVKSYFSILEDTLLGFILPAHSHSTRKSLKAHPKFYFIDTGIQRALSNTLDVRLKPQTSLYGQAFEHWVITEAHRYNHYFQKDFQLSYLRTSDEAEIDLILSKPSQSFAIEIKSQVQADEKAVKRFSRIAGALPHAKPYYLSRDPISKEMHGVQCRPWHEGLLEILTPTYPEFDPSDLSAKN